ncbi:hypothetical protein [Desulfogranum marinum]|uniref:hypothetical protein n=1 Tax=Desulfogranum marinum TaxID=453220 RepID=UPI001E5AC0A1|nr:hypothetical protein [Desulfogranum marinum]
MGRVAIELAYVIPDNKTTYISDDGTNVGFFMFVAGKTKDLSAGNLYSAKWDQVHNGSGVEGTLRRTGKRRQRRGKKRRRYPG